MSVISPPKAVYITGSLGLWEEVPPGQWKIISTPARGLLSIAVFPANPVAPGTVVSNSYVLKIFADPSMKDPPANPETSTTNLRLAWKDKFDFFFVPLRMPGGRSHFHIAIKNTQTSGSIFILVTFEA